MIDDRPAAEGMGFVGFLRVLRRRLWVVALCLVLVPAAALLWTSKQEKQYSATSKVLLRPAGFEESLAGTDSTSGSAGTGSVDADLATNISVAQLHQIAQNAARLIDRGVTAGAVSGAVEVSADGESNVLTVDATYKDPDLAARIANTYAAQYIAFRRQLDLAQVNASQRQITSQLRQAVARRAALTNRLQSLQSSGGSSREIRSVRNSLAVLKDRIQPLRDRNGKLATLAALENGNASVVQTATAPSSPSSPNRTLNLFAGIAIGLLLGIALAVVLELIDRSVRNPKEAETIFDRPILGTIPRSPALSGNNGLHLPAPDKESFRMLQANLLYFNGEKPVRSVLVTSAASGDGKSTVAWNAAAAGAEAGAKVLLMEADLRHPGFAARCGLKVDAGLSDVLLGHCELDDVVRETLIGEPGGLSTNGYANGNGHANGNGNGHRRTTATMDVVFAGRAPGNPTALIASNRMSSVIREAEAVYDLVVIDTPPVTVVSDAIPLVNQVTGVIVVARLGKNTREAALRLRDQLRNLNASVLGVVVNSIDTPDPYYRSLSHYVRAGAGAES